MIMQEVIVKGRGGQGAKTAVEILAKAANYEEKWYLAYPEFGPERSGTPINAYFKVDDINIRSREPIKCPDIIVVFDKTLENFSRGLKRNGVIIVNSIIEKKYNFVDASTISKEIAGRFIPNMVMLGALIKITSILKKESVQKAINDTFEKKVADFNIKCFEEGYKQAK